MRTSHCMQLSPNSITTTSPKLPRTGKSAWWNLGFTSEWLGQLSVQSDWWSLWQLIVMTQWAVALKEGLKRAGVAGVWTSPAPHMTSPTNYPSAAAATRRDLLFPVNGGVTWPRAWRENATWWMCAELRSVSDWPRTSDRWRRLLWHSRPFSWMIAVNFTVTRSAWSITEASECSRYTYYASRFTSAEGCAAMASSQTKLSALTYFLIYPDFFIHWSSHMCIKLR